MKRRIVIITGANSGIGKAAAIKFASENHTVIMACRDLKRSENAFRQALNLSANSDVHLMQVDISSFKSIKKFAQEFKSKFNNLDILINNAAFFEHGKRGYQVSEDGIELTFATNTFGPFLMTELLKDLLSKSDDARILNACTENIMHFFDPKRQIEFDNLKGEFRNSRKYSVYKMYGDSKMALLILTFRMAEEYKDIGIKVNAIIIPGVRISKDTIRKMSIAYRIAALIKHPFSLEPKDIADCYYYITTSENFLNVTGQAINKKNEIMLPASHEKGFGKIKELVSFNFIPKFAYDKNVSERIWELCKKIFSY